jgi:hypothetical protein
MKGTEAALARLVRCGACDRHFRLHESACPFCGSKARAAERRLAPGLAAGASRSRRYAVSAAFLASATALSCGSSTSSLDDESGESGDAGEGANGGTVSAGAGGTNAAGTGGARGGSGGAGASGRAGSEATSGTAGTNESGTGGLEAGASGSSQGGSNEGGSSGQAGAAAGTGGSAGMLVTGDRACEGSTERSGCRTTADCPPSTDPTYCTTNPPQTACRPIMPACPVCPEGMYCQVQTSCIAVCVTQCTEETCNGANHCVNSVCTPRPCEEEGANPCPDGFVCDAAYTASTTHCAPVSCQDGFECESWQVCTESSGDHDCAPAACATDADCGSCGYCVNAACSPNLGVCYTELPAMPYGCVWPDEELV